MLIQTKYFGEIEIDAAKVLHFEQGIFGFEDQKEFAVLYEGDAADNPFCWLQSVSESHVCLPLIDPMIWFPEYQPELPDDELSKIGELDPEAISVYTVTVVPENLENMTTNLRAPIVLNLHTKKGAQVVIEEGDYSIRENLYQRIKGTKGE